MFTSVSFFFFFLIDKQVFLRCQCLQVFLFSFFFFFIDKQVFLRCQCLQVFLTKLLKQIENHSLITIYKLIGQGALQALEL